MRRLVLLVAGVLLAVAPSAFAQDESRGEFSGGWRYYHATIQSSYPGYLAAATANFPKGWYADVAANLSPKFAIVGDVGGFYYSHTTSQTSGVFSSREELDFKLHAFMGGIRVRAPQHRGVVPFGQVLFGGEHNTTTDDYTVTIFQNTSTTHRPGNASTPVLALDGGVTFMAGVVGFRTSVGYVRMFGTPDADAFRLSLGAAFRF